MATNFQALLRRIVEGDIPREQRRVGEPTITGRPPSFPAQGQSPGFIPSMLIPNAFAQGAALSGPSIAPTPQFSGGSDDGDSDNQSTGGLGFSGGLDLSDFPGFEGDLGPQTGRGSVTSGNLANATFNSVIGGPLGLINSALGLADKSTVGDLFGNNELFGFDFDARGLDNPNISFDFGLGKHVDTSTPEALNNFGFGLQGLMDAIDDPFGTNDIDAEGQDTSAAANAAEGDLGDAEAHGGSDTGDTGGGTGSGDNAENDEGTADDDESGGCIISTALLAGGDWDRKTKLKAVRWCRDNHHDGSVRGEIWVDGYHCWGAKFVKLMKRYPWFKRFGLKISTAYLNQITKEKVSVLGFLTWAWVTPLSYVVGAVRRL